MTKKILSMFLLLALAAGLYVTAGAKGDRVADPISTAQPSRIATAEACKVYTGVDRGTVNLRACGSIACEVLDTLTEGESLTILKAGNWTQVTRADGVTGWLNSLYCKKEK
jgi:uncharacterized protein YgiM (DUF1202 family)